MNIYTISAVNVLPDKCIIKKPIKAQKDIPSHFLNIIPIFDYKLLKKYIKGKTYLIMTKILCVNYNSTNLFKIDISPPFKFKKTIKELVTKKWGFTDDNILKIKHIKNIDNIHNYLLILKPNIYSSFPSCISNGQKDIYKWRSLYSSHLLHSNKYKRSRIFKNISENTDPTKFYIANTDNYITLNDIYHSYSLSFPNI
tara:strand:+ start:20146 stop:20739 length:594 start_codon:yes stop_codon:yes gene_type:complete